ncbi:exopolyphosphatase [Pelagibaculum spongiae]|uniref:Exopolyphosphatase n=1 Tax=Pelagibaculum spongiae TaxID=2080658 RepID=A0A2V1GZZ7_9GAMM|nr:exopolyphosphatase [Pelagibaculum spongiae]PVZ67699.1 exopolyphosphatase [Pelagibaculum spongiae]
MNRSKFTIAALDLGSNSFHMVIARADGGELKIIEKLGEKVQLGAGLSADKILNDEAMQRGWDCLERFAQRLQDLSVQTVRIIATNTLRIAKNRQLFLDKAEQIMGHQVELVAGREEARLVYLGVAHTLADDADKRLVVDIGGGSTEFIIGSRFEPILTESLQMGCVSYRALFFTDDKITRDGFSEAEMAARQQVQLISRNYIDTGWDEAVGSSGTIKTVLSVLEAMELNHGKITLEALQSLRKELIKQGNVEKLELPGLRDERRFNFAPGVAVLIGLFKELEIVEMTISDGAVREGTLYDTIGRSGHENVRDRTIGALTMRYSLDTAQMRRVCETSRTCFVQVADEWALDNQARLWLEWAAKLHEIGLDISHSQFQKHGEYILRHSDLAGFSGLDQSVLATLVRLHRRKFSSQVIHDLPVSLQDSCKRLACLLRLAIILHHSRHDAPLPPFRLIANDFRLKIVLPKEWLKLHPLTQRDLDEEKDFLKTAGMLLDVEAE